MLGLRPYLIVSALLLATSVGPEARAQEAREGVVHVVDWPASVDAPERLRDHAFLPYLDTLAVGYRYGVAAGQPYLSLAFDWAPGRSGLIRGRRVDYSRLPADLRMVGLAVRAGVYAGGERVADLVVSVDSMMLAARPDYARVELDGLTWASVFVDTPADRAQALFDQGFELRDAEIVRVAFATFGDGPVARRTARRSGHRQPGTVVVYERNVFLDVVFALDWLAAFDDYPDPPRGVTEARGDRVGRGALVTGSRTGRSRNRGGDRDGDAAVGDDEGGRKKSRGSASKDVSPDSGDDGEDEEDEDNDLLPAALTAAAAVAFVAYKGGTVGYYGNAKYAPIGLSSGFVRDRWGMLFQAAVNESLLTGGDGPRRFVAKLMGFGSTGRFPVRPALGAGVLATEANDEVTLEPSFSVGAAAVAGPVLVHAAYDVAQGGIEMGLAVNFRARAFRKER